MDGPLHVLTRLLVPRPLENINQKPLELARRRFLLEQNFSGIRDARFHIFAAVFIAAQGKRDFGAFSQATLTFRCGLWWEGLFCHPSPMTHHHHGLILGNLGNVLGGHSL